MQFPTLLLTLAPALVLASPTTIESRQELQRCCYLLDPDGNALLVIADKLAWNYLDTLMWCEVSVHRRRVGCLTEIICRDPNDPNNCAAAKTEYLSGYCNYGSPIVATPCPA
ncbi:hypothetical protein B0O99DRAFT_668320 [Bisporella sp. PMI_857]|nr:hypothetical protein B0O99DRAFT_590842 [Bisporella sp. PMI_857]KAH8600367.1 hypothetical protein B0O99DRAFT_668320 [Bisporella sp. PMI_857]